MVHLGQRAANDDDLELDGRSLLRALWEEPALGSRNRHFEALERAPVRRARQEVRLCRALLRELRRGRDVRVTALALREGPEEAQVELELTRMRARRALRLSLEALALLLEQPGAEALRARLEEHSPWPPGQVPACLRAVLTPRV